MLLFSVYMPTDSTANLSEFTECLSEIYAIIESESNYIDTVFVLGDFNSHPGELFCDELLYFATEQQLVCADIEFLGIDSDTYTFISDAHGCRRWLDHCLVTNFAYNCIRKVSVRYDVSWSDHFPLMIDCDFDVLPPKTVEPPLLPSRVIWGIRDTEQIGIYSEMCHNRLREIDFPDDLRQCSDKICDNVKHKLVIEKMYKQIVNILSEAAISSHTGCINLKRKKRYITGWNKHVKDAHSEARLRFNMWVLHNRPPCGEIYDNMRQSRAIFKSKLKWCQNNEDKIKMDIIATNHDAKNFGNFWKLTHKCSPRLNQPVSVEGLTEKSAIAGLFKQQFRVDPGSVPPRAASDAPTRNICSGETHICFTAKQVTEAIKNIKRGKSPGHDSLSVEHLRYAGVHLPRVLTMLFNFCVGHSYLPEDLMRTIVVPIVKNRTGDVSDKTNYRPISLATVVAKVLDSLLDRHLESHLHLHDAQFGFRSGLSTESAILSLKQTVRYYTDRKTPIYACFLDLSKAFDLVQYNILWEKMLQDTDIPVELISVFKYWYENQTNSVKWANTQSETYRLDCGVRQGGLTSPKLFNLYVNRLIVELSSTKVGCSIDGQMINNISYADDMVLLSPSIAALRRLLGICERYAEKHGLRYNSSKSEYMIFKSGQKLPSHVPPVTLCGRPLARVYKFKYLGHVLTEDLSDDLDMDRERRALAVRCNMLARRFARCSTSVKITLFRAYCQSFYSCALWIRYTQKAFSALRVQYNNAFRVMLGLPRFCSASGMFAEARVDGFHAIVRKRIASLMCRFRGSPNSILSTLADKIDSPFARHWVGVHVCK
ncbi:hypothetical protein JYU34_017603 [Plutella xylostella]|uniref:Reverse transcriptase domain-containing protein n=1 Tax=Plutella xylostella TaxID=51655 RepID=A0ABQ7Q1L6_PLUXY|nr:hypothetical protein JYU34_017603 [Plutella xylostella]